MSLVTISSLTKINLKPQTVTEEVIQNVQTILGTVKGSVPLNRDFGVDIEAVDLPQPMAMMQVKINIIEAIQKYEPRAVIRAIDFDNETTAAADGILKPKITLEINEDA
nr:MAG TPA: baseplate wedge subunit [Caudoviricetes sp.]